jgi:hypothetical protein
LKIFLRKEPDAPARLVKIFGAGGNRKMYVNGVASAEDAEFAPIEMMIGRRSDPRLRVELPARIQVGECARDVLVQDVSATGARLQLKAPPGEGTEGLLIWDDLVCSCRVIWSASDACGVQFD